MSILGQMLGGYLPGFNSKYEYYVQWQHESDGNALPHNKTFSDPKDAVEFMINGVITKPNSVLTHISMSRRLA